MSKSDEVIRTTLPQASDARKGVPLYEGLLKYFPAALTEVARISKIGNDKHNPGEPMHHARGKSSDHADCIMRHLIDLTEDRGKGVGRDEEGVPQVGYIVWRALALAQEWLEKNAGAPLAPGAKVDLGPVHADPMAAHELGSCHCPECWAKRKKLGIPIVGDDALSALHKLHEAGVMEEGMEHYKDCLCWHCRAARKLAEDHGHRPETL